MNMEVSLFMVCLFLL